MYVCSLTAGALTPPASCWTESRSRSPLPPHSDTLLQSLLSAERSPLVLMSAAPSPPIDGGLISDKPCPQSYCYKFRLQWWTSLKSSPITFKHHCLTKTAWSNISQPCTYAVSMSMQWVRLSLWKTDNSLFKRTRNKEEEEEGGIFWKADSLTLACLWNTWCKAETCSQWRTGCRAPRGALQRQRCL